MTHNAKQKLTVGDLAPNPKNPRTITDAKLAQLKKALTEFGDLGGFVFNRKTKRIVGGHQRAKVFKNDSAVVIERKYPKPTKVGTVAEGHVLMNGERFKYREVYWDDVKEKAANIAANKGAGEWDFPQLTEWMKELAEVDFDFDLDLTMFDEKERNKMLQASVEPAEGQDDVPTAPKVAKTKPGDLYILGDHRLICGDSTNAQHVTRLMDGQTADITFTSPPYNLGSNSKLRGHNASGKKPIYQDDDDEKTGKDYLQFLNDWSALAITHSKYLFCNIQMLAGNKIALCEYIHTFKNNLVDVMIWDKEHGAPAMAPNCLNSAWEFIFILCNETDPKRSIKSGNEFRGTLPNIFRLNPMGKKDPLAKDHGAVFPVAFVEHFLINFTKESVLDLFGGSGTTMIAAEKHNRRSYLMELDPVYCDVIVERWQQFTGRKAKLAKQAGNIRAT